MKLLFVARNIPLPDYHENDIVLQLADRLGERGVQVSVLFPAEWLPFPRSWLRGAARAVGALGRDFALPGRRVRVLRYVRLPGLAFSYLCAYWFWPRVRDRGVAAVHAHYALPDGLMGLRLARQRACPLIVSVRAGDLRKMEQLPAWAPVRWLFDRVLQRADLLFSPSASVVAALRARGLPASQLPHGVSGARRRVAEQGAAVRVLVAATLLPGKRVDWVVRALAAYRGDRELELLVLGDGECLDALQRQAAEADLQATFAGRVDREAVFEQMERADIFALPSASETFGLVYLEAALRECAVVAIKGTGVDGSFCPRREMAFADDNYRDFEALLHRLVEREDERRALAGRASQRVARDYLWDGVVDGYLDKLGEARKAC